MKLPWQDAFGYEINRPGIAVIIWNEEAESLYEGAKYITSLRTGDVIDWDALKHAVSLLEKGMKD